MITTQRREDALHQLMLNPLGSYFQLEAVRHLDHCCNDGAVLFVATNMTDKGFVDLELVDLKALQDKIGADRLSFGSADRLFEFLGVRPGAVSPFTVINDTEHRVRLALDSSLMEADMLYFHPLVNDLTLGVTPDGLRKFLEVTGHEPMMVSLQPPILF